MRGAVMSQTNTESQNEGEYQTYTAERASTEVSTADNTGMLH